jgi:hypothetical protein
VTSFKGGRQRPVGACSLAGPLSIATVTTIGGLTVGRNPVNSVALWLNGLSRLYLVQSDPPASPRTGNGPGGVFGPMVGSSPPQDFLFRKQ